MAHITTTEREALTKQLTELLDKYDYEYTMEALDKIIDTWDDNKGHLIEAFKKHPNYVDGKFLIAFESDYDREIDREAIYSFVYWIKNTCMSMETKKNLPPEVLERTNNFQYLPNEMFDFLWYNLTDFQYRTITENDSKTINKVFPTIKAHDGEKTSRVVNRIFTYLGYNKHPDYNRQFAKYADALSPIKIKRHTTLSINPIDYLTMSFGNSWSSCHTIDKTNKRNMPNTYEGQYSSGTMSYLLDPSSMVFYTVDASYNGNDFFTQPKINRQMYHWGNDMLLQARLYPQSNDGSRDMYKQYRAVVQNIMSVIFDFPNLWTKKSCCIEDHVNSYGTHYRDYENFDDCNISTPNSNGELADMTIGHSPICISCGREHEVEENINCCRGGGHYCADCGAWIPEDDEIWINDETYCSDCATWCDQCHEYERAHRVQYVDGYGNVCEWCLDNYDKCIVCDEWHTVDDLEEIDGDYYCKSCYDKKMAEEEENNTDGEDA